MEQKTLEQLALEIAAIGAIVKQIHDVVAGVSNLEGGTKGMVNRLEDAEAELIRLDGELKKAAATLAAMNLANPPASEKSIKDDANERVELAFEKGFIKIKTSTLWRIVLAIFGATGLKIVFEVSK